MAAPTHPESARWYALHSKPKQEARAEANLRGWGVETLFPRMREFAGGRGRRSSRVTPLFPNYLFGRFDAATMISKIRHTRGIHRVVGFGEHATPIDDEIISFIQGRIAEDGLVAPPEPQPGDVVEVVEGPLRSLVGVFERQLKGRDRVLVLLTTLSSCARVQVAKASIQKARSVA